MTNRFVFVYLLYLKKLKAFNKLFFVLIMTIAQIYDADFNLFLFVAEVEIVYFVLIVTIAQIYDIDVIF